MKWNVSVAIKVLCLLFCLKALYYLKLREFLTMGLHQPFWHGHDRIKSMYKFAFLHSDFDEKNILSEADGRGLFVDKCQMSNCVLTNDKGFMPIRHYDAVLFTGKNEGLPTEFPPKLQENRFLLTTSRHCANGDCFDGRDIVKVGRDSAGVERMDLCEFCRTMWSGSAVE